MLTDMWFIQNPHTRELISAQALWTLFCLRFFSCNWCLFLPFCPDQRVLPESVEKWLESLHLGQYLDTFVSHKYNTMLRVIKLWELELNTVCESEPCVMCVTFHCHSEVLGAYFGINKYYAYIQHWNIQQQKQPRNTQIHLIHLSLILCLQQ